MATFYVKEQGAVIQKVDERLLVTKNQKQIARFPLHEISQLVVMGNVQLTTQAMAMLLAAGVDVVLASQYGKIRGRLLSDESKYVELRVRQLQALSNPSIALTLAKQIVLGKLLNQEAFVLQNGFVFGAEIQENAPNLTRSASQIRAMLHQGLACDNADSLRGFEGRAAAFYWPAFRRMLNEGMGFEGRAYRPPPDPVNALLSFGYALLQKDVTASVRLTGLEMYLGFFHTVQYGRPSLVLDLMEEFRPLVVDGLVLNLINHGSITASDFRRGKVDEGLTLKEASLRRVITGYEERLETQIAVMAEGRQQQASLRRCIEIQVRQFARVIKGEAQEFVPLALAARHRGAPQG